MLGSCNGEVAWWYIFQTEPATPRSGITEAALSRHLTLQLEKTVTYANLEVHWTPGLNPDEYGNLIIVILSQPKTIYKRFTNLSILFLNITQEIEVDARAVSKSEGESIRYLQSIAHHPPAPRRESEVSCRPTNRRVWLSNSKRFQLGARRISRYSWRIMIWNAEQSSVKSAQRTNGVWTIPMPVLWQMFRTENPFSSERKNIWEVLGSGLRRLGFQYARGLVSYTRRVVPNKTTPYDFKKNSGLRCLGLLVRHSLS